METKETFIYKTAKAPKIVLACSGCSDLGELSDRVARKLHNESVYTMKCLAMVGADHKELIDTIKTTETLVIDGCPVDCGKIIMEEAWLTNYQYVRLTDLGLVKGQTPVTEEIIDKVYNHIVDGSEIQTIEKIWPPKDSCCGTDDCDMFDFMSQHIGLKILHPGGTDATKQMYSLLNLRKGQKVLDIACGKGRASVEIAKKFGCKVVGFDILESSVREATEYAKQKGVEHLVSFIQADAEKLPFNDNEFDVTISQAMLILVNDKDKVIQEALRVLKPCGVSAWNELSWKKPVDAEFKTTASKAICGKCIANVVTFDEWENLFKANGYNNVSVNAYGMNNRGFSKMISDEGIFNATKVMYKYLANASIRKRMKNLDLFFKTYPEYLGYGIYITKKIG
jgi:ubiquinone/menaquinone biosynthesis C-methylase UbiE/uncharacterized metal-binding protein